MIDSAVISQQMNCIAKCHL